MKKVKWTWECGENVPHCPHCNELAYRDNRCVFCGKPYIWVDSTIKPTVVDHEGYTIVQCTNNHIQIYKDDRIVMHASCTKKMTEEELKKQVDFLKTIREGKDEG